MRMAMLASLILDTLAVLAADDDKRGTGKDDQEFVNKAAASGKAEVMLSTLAAKQASSSAVKKFAQHMVEDHTKANKELATLAEKLRLRVPEKVDPRDQEKMTELKKLTGESFDKEYITHQVKAHEESVALFQKQAEKGSNEELRAWAKKTLPTLQEHLMMARKMSGSEKGRDAETGREKDKGRGTAGKDR